MNKEEISKSIEEGLKILKQEPNFVFNMEEIKTIEYLQKHVIPYHNIKGNIEFLVNEITLNLISKLQKELDKSNERIDMCIDLLNLEGCLNFDTKQEKLDDIDRLVEIDKASYLEQIFPKNERIKELDKKDKVIDKMAEYIEDISKDTEVPVHKQAIIDFYYKKVEEEND